MTIVRRGLPPSVAMQSGDGPPMILPHAAGGRAQHVAPLRPGTYLLLSGGALDDLAGADGEERLPAAAGAGGAADVGEG